MTASPDIAAIDPMIGFPSANASKKYEQLRAMANDAESASMEFPAEYMFRQVPNHLPDGANAVDVTVGEMDHCGVAVGMIGAYGEHAAEALERYPDRFVCSVDVDPNDIGAAIARVRRAHEERSIRAVTSFPAGCNPQVPISDRRYYPIYQTCVDLGLPIVLNAGIPGPRVPGDCQHVMHFDQVCFDFPDLVVVMRHGAEPWEELAVKLMLKWPGLHYMTSGFAPRYYPQAIIDYANTRGAEKVLYAGYYPMGLSLRRIFDELPGVGLKDELWPKFLRDNAARIFDIEVSASPSRGAEQRSRGSVQP